MIITNEMAKCVDNFIPVSSRVMLLQMRARPVNFNIIQVHAPTADKPEEQAEELYHSINQVMRKLRKEDVTIVMGDFNAKIGRGRTSEAVGPFGLGEKNERGDLLEIFSETNKMAFMNTWFKLHPRQLYTWTAPKHKTIF